MKRNTKQTFIKIAHLCEILLSIVILLVILLGIFDILREVYGAYIIDFANPVNYEQLNNFLAQILLLVIARRISNYALFASTRNFIRSFTLCNS